MQKQLETLRETHTHEVEDLTKKLEETEDKLWQLKNNVNAVPAPPANASNSLSPYAGVPHTNRRELDTHTNTSHHNQHRRQHSHGSEENRIDITNMIREEGEVSTFLPFIFLLFVSLLMGTSLAASALSLSFLLLFILRKSFYALSLQWAFHSVFCSFLFCVLSKCFWFFYGVSLLLKLWIIKSKSESNLAIVIIIFQNEILEKNYE